MRNIRLWLLALLGYALVAGGVVMLLVSGGTAYAQDDEPEYVGRSECSDCHSDLSRSHRETAHSLTLVEVEQDELPEFIADFTQGEEIRTVQFPGESAARPFTPQDIAFILGSGRNVQRYVYQVGEEDAEGYRVFPAEWNVKEGQWQPYTPAESWEDPAYDFLQNCAYCHTTDLNIERVRWRNDGVQCESCHGPGLNHVETVDDAGSRPDEEELVAIRASINDGTDPQICGQCHSRGTGTDGTVYPDGYLPGETLSDAFTLAMPEDSAHYWTSDHASQPNMQYNEWLMSGHSESLENFRANDFKQDYCLSCHSTDYGRAARLNALFESGERETYALEMPTVDTAVYGVTCLSCHNPHSTENREAMLVSEPYALCTSCHNQASIESDHIHHPVQEMYEGADFIEGIDAVEGAHFVTENGPDCQTCHMPEVPMNGETYNRASHSMNPVLPGQVLDVEGLVDTCSQCHEEQAEPASLQQLIDDIQTDTRARLDAARAAITDSTPEWVTRALDFVEGDGSLGIHNYAYADALLDAVFTELGLFASEQ